MNSIIDIPNTETEIGRTIKMLLSDLSDQDRTHLLNGASEDTFITDRVDLYLSELTTALDAGLDELGAKEIARAEAFAGLQ